MYVVSLRVSSFMANVLLGFKVVTSVRFLVFIFLFVSISPVLAKGDGTGGKACSSFFTLDHSLTFMQSIYGDRFADENL